MLSVIVTAVVSMVFGVMLIELEVAAGHGAAADRPRGGLQRGAQSPAAVDRARHCGLVDRCADPRAGRRSGSTSWAPPPHPARCSP